MSSSPLPSFKCLLADLPTRAVGDKVRFLGCVTSYSTNLAILTLEHSYPSHNQVRVAVNVELLLKGLGHAETDIGQWVNVIGYVTAIKQSPLGLSRSRSTVIETQALVLWMARDLDIAAYEATFVRDSAKEIN